MHTSAQAAHEYNLIMPADSASMWPLQHASQHPQQQASVQQLNGMTYV
jgi:hypothetical protein